MPAFAVPQCGKHGIKAAFLQRLFLKQISSSVQIAPPVPCQ
jgi:hypothetical protein